MSAIFAFHEVSPQDSVRNDAVKERFRELVPPSHKVAVDLAPNQTQTFLRMCTTTNGQQREPHANIRDYLKIYRLTYKLGDQVSSQYVDISTAATTDAHSEAVVHPLVDVLVRVLLEEQFSATLFVFKSTYSIEDFRVSLAPISPCSRATLEAILQSSGVSRKVTIVMRQMQITEALIPAFATSNHSSSKVLDLEMDGSSIADYAAFGQSLRNNRNLRVLTITPRPETGSILPLLEGLASHRSFDQSLVHLEIRRACGGAQTTETEPNVLWPEVSRIRVSSLCVHQGFGNPMSLAVFREFWRMIAHHPTITSIDHGDIGYLTSEHIQVVKSTLQVNSRICEITGLRPYQGFPNRPNEWVREVQPLLSYNRMDVPIQDMLNGEMGSSQQHEHFLGLLTDETSSTPLLFHILRRSVPIWLPPSKPSRKRTRENDQAEHKLQDVLKQGRVKRRCAISS